ncbi:hypothetical protein PV387_14710, partial [Streptomyces sp. ME02-6987-2C]|nr:hypothetical protein [Streptomyces sp. ME02-6987-2C]
RPAWMASAPDTGPPPVSARVAWTGVVLGHGGFQRASTGSGGAGRGWGGGAAGSCARDGDSVSGTAGQDGVVIVFLFG